MGFSRALCVLCPRNICSAEPLLSNSGSLSRERVGISLLPLYTTPCTSHLTILGSFLIWFGLEIWSVDFGFNTNYTGRV